MAFVAQTYSVGEVLTASKMNQVDLNVDLIRASHIGTAAPAELTAGVKWIDSNVAAGHLDQVWDGVNWLTVAKLDTTNHVVLDPFYIDLGGAADVYTATLVPAPIAYFTGMKVRGKVAAATTSTGAATLNVNALGAKAIEKLQSALVAGDMTAGDMCDFEYDGVAFQLTSPTPGGLVSGDVIPAANGTVSLPGITFASDTDTGIYRIGVNNWAMACGGVKVMEFSAAGIITTPLNPAFFAYYSGADVLNVTGDGTTYVPAAYNTEAYDNNSDYDNATFILTSPVTGRWNFNASVYLLSVAVAHLRGTMEIVASNRSLNVWDGTPFAIVYSASACVLSGGGDVDMDAADTSKVQINVSGGTKIIDHTSQYFSGHLIG